MTTRLYYGSPRPRGCEPDDLTREDLPPDGEFYCDGEGRTLPVNGVRLTKEPTAWSRTYLLICVDVPLDVKGLLPYRVQWDWEYESYDLPESLV